MSGASLDVESAVPGRARMLRGSATLLLYHVIFLIAFLGIGPVLLWRFVFDKRYRKGLAARMGWLESSPPGAKVIWIHGVSVGEIKGATTLIETLQREYPEFELALSATTPTGHDIAGRLHPGVRVFFYPIDFGTFPGRALDRIRPHLVLLMEKELWPNFIQAAARRGVPVAVVNGRISERSFRGYRRVRWLLPQLLWVDLFCVQDDTYTERLRALGVAPARIRVTGNTKYDSVEIGGPPCESARIREWLSPDGRAVVVAGSTHGQEDVWVADAVRTVADRIGRPVRLVLAPRHPERSPAVQEALHQRRVATRRWSECADVLPALSDGDVVLVDTIGHLETFYGACDVAFVGGSLVPHGGQNMIEPAALGKAVVFGPNVANFRRDVETLLGVDAARQVEDARELVDVLAQLIEDPALCQQLGAAAVDAIAVNKGATSRTLDHLRPLLERGRPRPASAH